MAWEVSSINNVTVAEMNGVYFYYFPKATVKVNTNPASINDHTVEIRQLDNFPIFVSRKYEDITDKLGSSNALEYANELAARQFFFEVVPGENIQLFEDVDKITKLQYTSDNALNSIVKVLTEIKYYIKSIAES